jgi:hypothetical protein
MPCVTVFSWYSPGRILAPPAADPLRTGAAYSLPVSLHVSPEFPQNPGTPPESGSGRGRCRYCAEQRPNDQHSITLAARLLGLLRAADGGGRRGRRGRMERVWWTRPRRRGRGRLNLSAPPNVSLAQRTDDTAVLRNAAKCPACLVAHGRTLSVCRRKLYVDIIALPRKIHSGHLVHSCPSKS